MGSDSFSGVPYPSVEPCPYCTCQGKTPVCINGVCKCLTCQKLGDSPWFMPMVEVTIKEYSASAHTVVLKPRSTNKNHKPIVAGNDFQVQGVVVTVIPNLQE